jgi:hypothetical protein
LSRGRERQGRAELHLCRLLLWWWTGRGLRPGLWHRAPNWFVLSSVEPFELGYNQVTANATATSSALVTTGMPTVSVFCTGAPIRVELVCAEVGINTAGDNGNMYILMDGTYGNGAATVNSAGTAPTNIPMVLVARVTPAAGWHTFTGALNCTSGAPPPPSSTTRPGAKPEPATTTAPPGSSPTEGHRAPGPSLGPHEQVSRAPVQLDGLDGLPAMFPGFFPGPAPVPVTARRMANARAAWGVGTRAGAACWR